MKNILLATDLSAAAADASAYAAWLAGMLGARLTVMTAYRAAPVFAGSTIPESPEDRLPELVNCRLEETAARLGAGLHIAVDVLARKGDPVRAILTAALDIDADLIVVGQTGAGHAGQPVSAEGGYPHSANPPIPPFGTTAVALARKTPVPLLIVPQGAACVPPKTIAVPKELLAGEIRGALRELLGGFGCRLYLFGVKAKPPGEIVEIYQAEAIHSAGKPFHVLYEIPVDKKLPHSIENFIGIAPIHWLAARPLPGLTPHRWVLRGRSKELAFDIRVPFLILPETERSTEHHGSRSL